MLRENERGIMQQQVALSLNVSRSVVSWVIRRFHEGGGTNITHKNGNRGFTAPRKARSLVTTAKRNQT
ncbi:hypothetical protein HHI36_002189, partial [Cryptolaemus montrouzieri]